MAMSSAIRAGRSRALKRMTDRCTIERPTGVTTTHPTTGKVTANYTQLVTDYPTRLRSYEANERTDDVGGHESTVQRSAARFPVSATYVPHPGDRLTITASTNPALAVEPSRVFLIANVPQNTHATSFRVYVDEVPS